MGMINMRADWRQIPARRVDRWIVAADLGQSTDPTAISVLHHRVTPLDEWKANDAARTWKQVYEERFDVRHLERLPLETAYPVQVQHVAALLQRPPLNACAPKLVIDETGVGRPVGDMFDDAGLWPNRITITSGLEATQHGARTWHVPKGMLVSNLEARSHAGELRIAARITESGPLKNEMKNFRRKVSDAGRATYAARTGEHDDLVLSVALGLWMATSGPSTHVSELRI